MSERVKGRTNMDVTRLHERLIARINPRLETPRCEANAKDPNPIMVVSEDMMIAFPVLV